MEIVDPALRFFNVSRPQLFANLVVQLDTGNPCIADSNSVVPDMRIENQTK